jgi:hypothetical protein
MECPKSRLWPVFLTAQRLDNLDVQRSGREIKLIPRRIKMIAYSRAAWSYDVSPDKRGAK